MISRWELSRSPSFISFKRELRVFLKKFTSVNIYKPFPGVRFSSELVVLSFWMLNTGSWSSLYCSFVTQIVLGIECQLTVLCKTFLCLCTSIIVVTEKLVVCFKYFPLLLYSESSCSSAMSDGKITVPGHYRMKVIQTSCGQSPNRGTMKCLFLGWEQRNQSSFFC